MWRIYILLFMSHALVAMLIPEETEMLDGFAPASFQDVSPELDYFEARSLSAGSLFNSIRNKRNSEYEVKESNGLVSHFRPNSVNGYITMFKRKNQSKIPTSDSVHPSENLMRKKFPSRDDDEEENKGPRLRLKYGRQRRNVQTDKKVDSDSQKDAKQNNQRVENLPSAMKLTKTSNGFASSQNGPSAAALVSSKWTRSPFEYSKIQTEEDSLAMDSSSTTLNEGMKSRTPRVNFVTQQKKSLDHDETKASATKSEFYKSPPLLHNSKESTSATSLASNERERERYPERGSTMRPVTYPDYRNRDMNSNRYDDRYIEDMYPPPPDYYDPMYDYRQYPHIDPYMQRPSYSEYNNYHSHRYDLPDYQDYPPMYGNDIESRYYMRSDMPPPSTLPRKRTIYYAYLPEVVRSPPTVDFRYRSHDRYDPYYHDYAYNYYDQPMMSGAYRRPVPERQMIAEKSSMRVDYRTSRPLRIRDDAAKVSTSKEKRFDQDKSYYDDAKRPMYTYRKPNDYNSMY